MGTNLKTWKVSLPEDSPVLTDLLEYGREMGMQPAEVTRVILTEWSRAMRGRNPFAATMAPHTIHTPPEPSPIKKSEADAEREKAKTRFAKFGKATAGLDDDE